MTSHYDYHLITMNIDLTEQEYKLLLNMVYMADWVLHAHSDTEEHEDTKGYSELHDKLLSYAKNTALKNLVKFDKKLKKHYETAIFEEESPALEYIEEFEDDTFWSELISRLSKRDAMLQLKANNLHDVETEELFTAISNAEQVWSKEFEAYGLDRIRTNKALLDSIH